MWVKNSDELYHRGKKGMKWGYNDGRRNGKRTAGDYDNSAAEKFVEEYGETIGDHTFRGYENGYAVYVNKNDPNDVRKFKFTFNKKSSTEITKTEVTTYAENGKKYVEEHISEVNEVGTQERNLRNGVLFVNKVAQGAINIGKGLAYLAKEASKKK